MATGREWLTIRRWTWILAVAVVTCSATGQENQPEPVYKIGGDVTAPQGIYTPNPTYTLEARQKGITGEVSLKLIVRQDGTASDIRVVKGLDPGLDQSTVEAVAHWRFQPGTKSGMPVSVEVSVVTTFRTSVSGIQGQPLPGVYHDLPCATKIDSRDIKSLLKKAYKGDPKAQFIIGCACEYGVARLEPDRVQAIDWYRKAAESLVPAQYFLGEAHLFSYDYVQAYTWFKIADSGGYKDPHDRLKMVTQILTQKELSEAEEQVAAWKRQHGMN